MSPNERKHTFLEFGTDTHTDTTVYRVAPQLKRHLKKGSSKKARGINKKATLKRFMNHSMQSNKNKKQLL